MATKRKTLKLAEHEMASLIGLYLQKAIPIDQYEERQTELSELVDAWRQETGRSDSAETILHFMRTKRKAGKWVKLGSNHVRKEVTCQFSADERDFLMTIVKEHVTDKGIGSDNLAYDPEVAAMISKEFGIETGRRIPPGVLIAEITAIRKRGLLEKIDRNAANDVQGDIGFVDIDLATG
jgi:hypothetical protein